MIEIINTLSYQHLKLLLEFTCKYTIVTCKNKINRSISLNEVALNHDYDHTTFFYRMELRNIGMKIEIEIEEKEKERIVSRQVNVSFLSRANLVPRAFHRRGKKPREQD